MPSSIFAPSFCGIYITIKHLSVQHVRIVTTTPYSNFLAHIEVDPVTGETTTKEPTIVTTPTSSHALGTHTHAMWMWSPSSQGDTTTTAATTTYVLPHQFSSYVTTTNHFTFSFEHTHPSSEVVDDLVGHHEQEIPTSLVEEDIPSF